MRLSIITEAYDRELGQKKADLLRTTPQNLRAWVSEVDPTNKYGVWVLKQITADFDEDGVNIYADPKISGDMLDAPAFDGYKADLKNWLKLFDDRKGDLTDRDINSYSYNSLIAALGELSGDSADFDPKDLEGVDLVCEKRVGDIIISGYVVYNADSLALMCGDSDLCVADESVADGLIYGMNCPALVFFKNGRMTSLVMLNGKEHVNSNNTAETRPTYLNLAKSVLPGLMDGYVEMCKQKGCDQGVCEYAFQPRRWPRRV
jgi:hypothetical protein